MGVNGLPALILMLVSQETDTVKRLDSNRSAYQDAVDACRDAERMMESSPEAVIERLRSTFADSIDRGKLTFIERRIFIEAKAQEQIPHEFYPFHLRGKARLLVARTRKDEDARKLLLEAAGDLQNSVIRGAARSKDLLGEARKELWENLRGALGYEAWKPGRAALADQAFALLATTDLATEADRWTAAEALRIETLLRELRRQPGDPDTKRAPARLALGWCEAVGAAVKALPAFAAAGAAAQKTGVLATAIRDSRGFFRLKIGVSPYATVTRLERDGEEIPLSDRDTPLLVAQDLEIDDYQVELSHPNGRKNANVFAKDLEAGRTYVLWGNMNSGEFKVSALPK
jgi:hypothetical protein